jgi:hypothetical protein
MKRVRKRGRTGPLATRQDRLETKGGVERYHWKGGLQDPGGGPASRARGMGSLYAQKSGAWIKAQRLQEVFQ